MLPFIRQLGVELTLGALAVLGLHAIKDKPVAVNGKVEIRPVRQIPSEVTTGNLLTCHFR